MRQLVGFTTHNWRFILKTFISSNTLGRRLMLASAGLLLCANGAFAAEVAGDAQMQARDLLSGTVGGRPKFTAPQAASLDPPADAMPVASVQSIRRVDIGGQELAQRMLLGKGV
jgi:hypothetical protein